MAEQPPKARLRRRERRAALPSRRDDLVAVARRMRARNRHCLQTIEQAARRNSMKDEYRPAIVQAAIMRLRWMGAAELKRDGDRWRAVTFEMLTRTAPRHGELASACSSRAASF